MKIILTDAKTVTQGDLSLKPLEEFGEVIVNELTAYDDIAETVRDADMIICCTIQPTNISKSIKDNR